jgi:peptidoglycan-N-acetylglucosamine deacetylase
LASRAKVCAAAKPSKIQSVRLPSLVGSLGAVARKAAAMLGPNYFFRRIMAAAPGTGARCVISFDCDFPRDIAVLPALVPLLQKYEIPASFACIGQWVRQFPSEHKLIVDAGFEIINHTETHPNLYHPDYDYARVDGLNKEKFNRISAQERREEIERGHATIVEVLGVEPVGFRTPHFGALHVDDIYALLVEMGYCFSSSVLAAERGGAPYRTPEGVWEVPVSPCPLHPFGVFDSWHSLSKQGARHACEGALAGLFATLVDAAVASDGLINVYFDPKDALESGELERMLQVVSASACAAVDYGELIRVVQAVDRETMHVAVASSRT